MTQFQFPRYFRLRLQPEGRLAGQRVSRGLRFRVEMWLGEAIHLLLQIAVAAESSESQRHDGKKN